MNRNFWDYFINWGHEYCYVTTSVAFLCCKIVSVILITVEGLPGVPKSPAVLAAKQGQIAGYVAVDLEVSQSVYVGYYVTYILYI